MKTLPKFKSRASSSGQLMVNPRSKTELISQTTRSYLNDWAKEHIYGIKKQIKSKYIDKGIQLEDTAIDKTIEWLDISFAMKNEKSFEDDYFTGTPDLIVDGVVYDTKCSWDAFSFPLFELEIPTSDYFYQLQVYMHLTGCKSSKLVYVLLNTPEQMIYETQHVYDHLPKELRIKHFDIEYDHDVIVELQNRVINARTYLSTLKF